MYKMTFVIPENEKRLKWNEFSNTQAVNMSFNHRSVILVKRICDKFSKKGFRQLRKSVI